MIGHKAAFSGTLMVAARLISRVIDLITMLILARLLSPTQFGLVAIAMTVVLIIEACLELPLSQALVRLPEIKPSYYDTAFTLGILRGVLICAGICLIAYPFANFYKHPNLVPLIQVLSIAPAARGLVNPRMAEYAKNLNFSYEFRFELVGKVAAFTVSAIVALATHSYWSIALGTVVAPVIFAAQSYFLVPIRIRLTLTDWRVFADFLGWMSLSQITLAIMWQSDQLLLGKLLPASILGLFSTSNSLTNIPLNALFSPVQRPLLSAFTVTRDEPARLRGSYQNAAAAVVTIGLPVLVGQSAVAGPMVRLMLGSRWLGAIPMVHWLAISLLPALFGVLVNPLAMALNQTRQLLWRNFIQLCIKLPIVIVGAIFYGFYGVIAARLIAETIIAFYCMFIVRKLVGAPVLSQLDACRRAILAVSVMAVGLWLSTPWLSFGTSTWQQLAELTSKAALGAALYSTTLLLLWKLAGAPSGIEAIGLRMLGQALKRFRRPSLQGKTI